MADSFFGFNTSSKGLDEELLDLEEEEYDAFNDETFNNGGSLNDDDWEESHTILAAVEETSRKKDPENTQDNDDGLDLDVVRSLNRFFLSDDDALPTPSTSRSNATKSSNNADFLPWSVGPGSLPPPPVLSDHELQFPRKPTQFVPPQLLRIPTVSELESKILENQSKSGVAPKATINNNKSPIQPPPGLINAPSRPPLVPTKPPGFPLPFENSLSNTWLGKGPPQAAPNRVHANKAAYPVVYPNHPQDMMMMRNHPPVNPLLLPQPGMGPPGMGFPMLNPRLVPQPNMLRIMPNPLRGFYPIINPNQMRHDNFIPGRNFPPPHPLLQQQHIWQQQQQQLQHMHQQQQRIRRNSEQHDEYAKLMNNRERAWLLNLQILQMTSDKPQVDDYYYTVWKTRREQQQKNGLVANHNNNNKLEPFFKNNRRESNGRERKDSEKEFSPRVYVPIQFENSLGRPQCGSVNAPRMVIDMEVVNTEAQNGASAPTPQKDQKKTKKILLELERLYILLIQAEDIVHGVEFNVDSEDNEEVEDPEPSVLVNKILQSFVQDDRFSSFLCVRKGKNLLLRCLSLVDDYTTSSISDIWSKFIKSFHTIVRRDILDNLLPKFYPHFKKWIESVELWPHFFAVAVSLQSVFRDGRTSVQSSSPSPSKPVLSHLIHHKLGVSIIAKILIHGEELVSGLKEIEVTEWTNFVQDLIKNMANLSNIDKLPKPNDAIPHNVINMIIHYRLNGLNSTCHETLQNIFES